MTPAYSYYGRKPLTEEMAKLLYPDLRVVHSQSHIRGPKELEIESIQSLHSLNDIYGLPEGCIPTYSSYSHFQV